MGKRLHILFITLLFSNFFIQAQDNTKLISYDVKTFGSIATNKQTPFWLVSNQHGIVPLKANNCFIETSLSHQHSINSKISWKSNIDLVASIPSYKNLHIQQLYSEISYNCIHLSIGSRNTNNDYNAGIIDMDINSGDMALSSNARPIPEINLYIPKFTIIPGTKGWVQTKGNFAVGRSFENSYISSFINGKQNYIQNPLWHHKSLYMKFGDSRNKYPISFTLGIRHVAQWGGNSTNQQLLGKQPHSFKDFIRIALGKSGDNNSSISDQKNALGAHYGTYDFQIGYEKRDWSLQIYYQHLFSDASGMEFDNYPDGLKGFQINFHNFKWINKVIVEHIYTLNQSGPFHFIDFDHTKYKGYGGGGDDYYNNGEYTTGYSHYNRSLGSPLLVSPIYNNETSLGFKHNRIQAWHLGLKGEAFSSVFYRFLYTNISSFGTPYAPTLKKLINNSLLIDISRKFGSWNIQTSVAFDRGSLLGNHLGFSVAIAKRGILFKK